MNSQNDQNLIDEVIRLIANELDIPPDRLSESSSAKDITEWDSMGVLGILAMCDRNGLEVRNQEMPKLQSVSGIIEIFKTRE